MEITPDKKKVIGLVEQAYLGSLCLPNFQRDFVWNREEIADLLRSILRGYFLGSLLMLSTDPQRPPFAPIALRGAKPQLAELQPEHLILDGQQRLTSLLYALYAPNLELKNSKKPRRYFINLELLHADPDNDSIVVDKTEREISREGLNSLETQWSKRLLPVTNLNSDAAFLRWRDGIDDWLRENHPDEHLRFREEWREQWTNVVQQFLSFEVPVIKLPQVNEDDQDSVARICAIFEKLNSTGVALSVYDLLTARLFRSSIDLHGLWDQANIDNPYLAEWSGGSADEHSFGVLVLRTMALMRGLEVKPKVLINLSPENFEQDWKRAAAAMNRALEIASHTGADGFGVFEQKWLPGFGLLPVLGALRAYIEDNRLGEEARRDLRRWYWCSVFLERYSSAVESKARRDYQDMIALWNGSEMKPIPFVDADIRIGSAAYSVRDSASTASSVYSGVFCLLAQNGARDWSAVEEITLQNLQDHHIFPRDFLMRHGLQSRSDKSNMNSITNRTLISGRTNQIIKAKAPAEYLMDIRVFPTEPETVLGQHFIDVQVKKALEMAADGLDSQELRRIFEQCRNSRENLIVARIREACGVTLHEPSAADLESIEED
mgnify:CR=1 FL=1